MAAGMILILFITVVISITLISNKKKKYHEMTVHTIKSGRLNSNNSPLKLYRNHLLVFTVMFGKNCKNVKRKMINQLYGYSIGFGNYDSISICWLPLKYSGISLFLRIVKNGVITCHSLCYVNDYEEIEVRLVEDSIYKTTDISIVKKTFRIAHIKIPIVFDGIFKRRLYPKLRSKENFDVDILIKE